MQVFFRSGKPSSKLRVPFIPDANVGTDELSAQERRRFCDMQRLIAVEGYSQICMGSTLGNLAGVRIDAAGQVYGQHKGIIHYTVGQRKGLGLALGAPVYVCDKDMEKNTVTVGPESELFTTTLVAGDFNWISIPELTAPMRVKAKARYRQPEQPATVRPLPDGKVEVKFDEPQRAITRGQAVVLYDGDVVVGGGTIL